MKFEDFKSGQELETISNGEVVRGMVERVSSNQVFIKWEDIQNTISYDWDDIDGFNSITIKTN